MKSIISFIHNTDGQDVIEYGLLAALISIAAIATIKLIGPKVLAEFDAVNGALT